LQFHLHIHVRPFAKSNAKAVDMAS
jgi:hypothetical protein